MPSSPPLVDEPGVASFTVDRLALDHGQLLVQGRWSGVRGMRFLRPTLVAEGHQVLATLEHKPWAPEDGATWTAAFPWTGPQELLDRAWLEVAPSITVPLGTAAPPPPREVAATERRPEAVQAAERREDEHAMEVRRARGERDRALAMRDEAVRDREAALRTRDRLARSREEAVAAAEEAERRRVEGIAEARRQRDVAVTAAAAECDDARELARRTAEERDRLREQREEVLLAHRALEATLRRERAEADRRADEPDASPAPPPHDARQDVDAREDHDVPIGVRAIPAARMVGAVSLTPRRTERADLGTFDRWALRVLATAAASSFVLLLLLLVRVFV